MSNDSESLSTQPSTLFELNLDEFITTCQAIADHAPRSVSKALKTQIASYKRALTTSLTRGRCHAMHRTAFKVFGEKYLTADWETLSDLAWLRRDAPLVYVKEDGTPVQELTINIAEFHDAIDEADNLTDNQFLYLFLRCCELTATSIERTVDIGRAARDFESVYESLDGDDGEAEQFGVESFKQSLNSFKNILSNKEIYKVGAAELKNVLRTIKDNPELSESINYVANGDDSITDKLAKLSEKAIGVGESGDEKGE